MLLSPPLNMLIVECSICRLPVLYDAALISEAVALQQHISREHDASTTTAVEFGFICQVICPKCGKPVRYDSRKEDEHQAIEWHLKLDHSVPDDMADRYTSLHDALLQAYERASKGKGADRHGENKPFTDQYICRGGKRFGLPALLYQIGKKNEELAKFLDKQAQVNELLDIIVYAAAAVIVLQENPKCG